MTAQLMIKHCAHASDAAVRPISILMPLALCAQCLHAVLSCANVVGPQHKVLKHLLKSTWLIDGQSLLATNNLLIRLKGPGWHKKSKSLHCCLF